MFDDEDYLESRTFPALHKTVLGLVKSNLRQQLELSTSTIDDTDADGRTALSWAAARGDFDAVNILLEFGADPNICSRRGQPPLQWAAQSPTERCAEILQALLKHNADVNHPDHQNRTVLINATADLDEPECLRILVENGADLNWQDCHKRTPLGYAAKMGKSRNLSYLLSCGADPHIQDHWGYTPLYEAILQNHHSVLQCLLKEANIIPTATFANGMSVLHVTAKYGDLETMCLLASKNMGTLNPVERNNECLTAQDLLNQRNDADSELHEVFKKLLEATSWIRDVSNHRRPEMHGHEDEDNIHDFVDAQEYQNVGQL